MNTKRKQEINLIVIGIGPHAKRIYLPYFWELENEYNVSIKLGIDIEEKRSDISEYLIKQGRTLDMHYIKPFDVHDEVLPTGLQNYLNNFVKENNINGVVISTEPLVHKQYAMWALGQGLHILMDKPISSRMNVATDMKEAMKIYTDYEDMLDLYKKSDDKKIFSVNVQRRYDFGFQMAESLISEVRDRFNAPVTSIQSMHTDGQWRLPSEIVTQKYHPYCQGYGKCSHSGYHIFDITWQLYNAGLINDKSADNAEVYTSFLNPQGFIQQFTEKDYFQYFGTEYEKVKLWNDQELMEKYKDYGEIDAFSNIRLLKDKVNICNISINLMHNSFARRTWINPGDDLYKGNGRVKHQFYNIQQGPFQSIQIHNYQSNDKHDKSDDSDYEVGGNNHFEIYIFRNSEWFGKDEVPYRKINIKDVAEIKGYTNSKLFYEQVKKEVVKEFVDYIQGNISKDQLKSNIESHEVPVKIMSSIYKSNINYINSQSPLVNFEIK